MTGHVTLGARVEHHALLPPPLNRIVEGFMAAQSAEYLHQYIQKVSVGPPPSIIIST